MLTAYYHAYNRAASIGSSRIKLVDASQLYTQPAKSPCKLLILCIRGAHGSRWFLYYTRVIILQQARTSSGSRIMDSLMFIVFYLKYAFLRTCADKVSLIFHDKRTVQFLR